MGWLIKDNKVKPRVSEQTNTMLMDCLGSLIISLYIFFSSTVPHPNSISWNSIETVFRILLCYNIMQGKDLTADFHDLSELDDEGGYPMTVTSYLRKTMSEEANINYNI